MSPPLTADRDQQAATERLVIRNFLTLGSGELFGRLIGFAAMVYVARALGVTAYGIVGFAMAVILYFQAFVDGGVELLGPREVAAAPDEIETLVPSVVTATTRPPRPLTSSIFARTLLNV